MSWSLKSFIFSLFSYSDGLTDTNKIPVQSEEDSLTVEYKGQLQRFNENLARDWDENLLPTIDNLLENTFIASSAYDKFIPYLEDLFGIPAMSQDIEARRRILKNVLPMYKVKGTINSYKILFSLLGFDSVEVEKIELDGGWDNPFFTFDSDSRTFDSNPDCYPCSYYRLKLTGTIALTQGLYSFIEEVLKIIEPINAKMYSFYYNGKIVLFDLFIQDNGDLIYMPYRDDIDFKLDANGDLRVSGNVPITVRIENNGDLTWPEF